jgi:pimeloyl-ACP methyl ester carboxylesterase
LVDEAGGSAFLYGYSSGAVLTLEAALQLGPKIKMLAIYEAPYNEDAKARLAWKEYVRRLTEALAAQRYGDAVALFFAHVGTPAAQIEGVRHSPLWPGLEALAPTLAYDHTALLGDTASIPVAKLRKLATPALVMYGTASRSFMGVTAETLSKTLPHAQLRRLEGETHQVSAVVLAPILVEFFSDSEGRGSSA